jgi:hypothetical protein
MQSPSRVLSGQERVRPARRLARVQPEPPASRRQECSPADGPQVHLARRGRAFRRGSRLAQARGSPTEGVGKGVVRMPAPFPRARAVTLRRAGRWRRPSARFRRAPLLQPAGSPAARTRPVGAARSRATGGRGCGPKTLGSVRQECGFVPPAPPSREGRWRRGAAEGRAVRTTRWCQPPSHRSKD